MAISADEVREMATSEATAERVEVVIVVDEAAVVAVADIPGTNGRRRTSRTTTMSHRTKK